MTLLFICMFQVQLVFADCQAAQVGLERPAFLAEHSDAKNVRQPDAKVNTHIDSAL